jgi:hypothetical protein
MAAFTVSRERTIPAKRMSLDGSSFVDVGAAPDVARAIQLADGASQGAAFSFVVPNDYVASTFMWFWPIWTPAAADAGIHAVQWQWDALQRVGGQSIVAAGTTAAWTGRAQANAANVKVVEAPQRLSLLGGVMSVGAVVRFNLRRLGGDTADTFSGAVNLLEVRVRYTAVY